jgi:hypothetical protein
VLVFKPVFGIFLEELKETKKIIDEAVCWPKLEPDIPFIQMR